MPDRVAILSEMERVAILSEMERVRAATVSVPVPVLKSAARVGVRFCHCQPASIAAVR